MSETAHQLEADSPQLIDSMTRFLRRYYKEDIGRMVRDGEPALQIEYRDVYQYDPEIADDYLSHPIVMNKYFEKALGDIDLAVEFDPSNYQIRMTDTNGTLSRRSLRELTAEDLGAFVAVEGQLSKVTGLSYRFSKAVFECQQCFKTHPKTQSRSGLSEPHKCGGCDRKGPFEIVMQESTLVDHRKLKIESPPEDRLSTTGESLIAYAEDELCHIGGSHGLPDRAGENVVVLGRFEGEVEALQSNRPPELDGYLVVESILFQEQKLDEITVEETREEFMALARGEQGDPVELLKASIAPTIERTDELDVVITAAVAWLFNAYRIDQGGGDQFRGDLHMAVIGDPATAKSSIMADVADIAPKSVFRSGGSISKVGLTASAQQEEFAGTTEWTLEPGVLPRANGGHCLIDEIDEVLDERSKAIHDALEGDQMVKVDKAGISADLPTRTAIWVSGNPKQGRFDKYESITEQLDMDPALLSRMDVLLPVTDTLDPDVDQPIAEKVAASYQELSVSEVASKQGGEQPEREVTKRPVSVDVFRDWVHYARQECYPVLTDTAKDALVAMYLDIRDLNDGYSSEDADAPIPATTRVLEAGIRLATAFARVELAEDVEEYHVEQARSILKTTIGLNFDRDTANFDADAIETGTPKSQRDRIKRLRDIISELRDEYVVEGHHDAVPIDDIVTVAGERGMDADKAEHTIEKMKRQGEIYEPVTGEVDLT